MARVFNKAEAELKYLETVDELIGEEYKEYLGNGSFTDYEYSIQCKAGVRRDIQIRINGTSSSNNGLLFICHDITEKNQIIESSDEKRRRTNSIMNNIPDLVWMKDMDGKYIACNHESEKYMGYTEAEIIGKKDDSLLSPERAASFKEGDLTALKSRNPIKHEAVLNYADGRDSVFVEATKAETMEMDSIAIP